MAEELFQPKQQEKIYQPAVNDGGKTTPPTTPTEKNDQFTPKERRWQRNKRAPMQCYHCREWGHIAAKCPKKVLEVNQSDRS